MKLLLDQNLSADAAVILRSRGKDADLRSGAVVTVTETSIRVRTLPFVRLHGESKA